MHISVALAFVSLLYRHISNLSLWSMLYMTYIISIQHYKYGIYGSSNKIILWHLIIICILPNLFLKTLGCQTSKWLCSLSSSVTYSCKFFRMNNICCWFVLFFIFYFFRVGRWSSTDLIIRRLMSIALGLSYGSLSQVCSRSRTWQLSRQHLLSWTGEPARPSQMTASLH